MPDKSKRILMHCSSKVDKSAISRTVIDGVEHIIIKSFTLPDDIVMNGITYPKSEIDKSFKTLDGTLAPIEHPIDSSGNYLSANTAYAIDNFYAGASNANVHKVNGRVSIDKVINVLQAMKSARGKRLLDRVKEIETSATPRPIHTSVGVYLEIKRDGDNLTANNLVFDHDAILLDSVGAAQPSQGVGMAVNAEGEQIDVHNFLITNNNKSNEKGKGNGMKELIINALKEAKIKTNGLDEKALLSAFTKLTANATETEKITEKSPSKTDINRDGKEGTKEGAQASTDDSGVEKLIANALRPLTDKITSLESTLIASADKDRAKHVELIVNSSKYPGMTAETMTGMTTESLKKLSENCIDAFGVAPAMKVNSGYEETTMVAE